MPQLTLESPRPQRPLYPGEMDLFVGSATSDNWETSRPSGFTIQFQHNPGSPDDGRLPWNRPRTRGPVGWDLRVRVLIPVMVVLDQAEAYTGDAGLLIEDSVTELAAFTGGSLALELSAYLQGMVFLFKSGQRAAQARVTFNDLRQYNDLMFSLETQARHNPVTPGLRVESLRRLLTPWGRDYQRQLDWYDSHPSPAGEAVTFAALRTSHMVATHLQLTDLGAPLLRPRATTAGEPFPGRPGYITGICAHAVAGSEWLAGYRTCERCQEADYEPEPTA